MALEPSERINMVVTFNATEVTESFLVETVLDIEGVEDVSWDPAH